MTSACWDALFPLGNGQPAGWDTTRLCAERISDAAALAASAYDSLGRILKSGASECCHEGPWAPRSDLFGARWPADRGCETSLMP